MVTTRGGDGGDTSLGDGTRVRKDALRIEAIGCVDEANSAIGVLRLATRDDPEADAMLARIQHDLFDVGADLCVPGEGGERLRVSDTLTARLEQEVAEMNAALPPLTSFVLPAGSPRRGTRACRAGRRAPCRAARGGAGRCGTGKRCGGALP